MAAEDWDADFERAPSGGSRRDGAAPSGAASADDDGLQDLRAQARSLNFGTVAAESIPSGRAASAGVTAESRFKGLVRCVFQSVYRLFVLSFVSPAVGAALAV
jgi:hypothetical protein